MSDNLVSLVVTSFNHAEFLQQRMESLLAQTYPNTEIIVVDDGSTDPSREFLLKYKEHPKVSLYFLESNNGYVYASNFGAGKAKGKYIVFAECDDFSQPDQIATLFQTISANQGVGVVWSESNLTDEKGRVLPDDPQKRSAAFRNFCSKDVRIPGSLLQKFMLHGNVVPNMSAAMFRKELFEGIGGLSDKYRLSADYDFWIRMSEAGDFYYLKRPLNNFRSHESSVRNRLGESVQLIEMIDIVSGIKKKLRRSFKEKLNQKIHLGNLWFYYARNDFGAFVRTFLNVLTSTFRLEPLLLFFLIFSIPFLSVKKLGKLLIQHP
jgi:glycosyltransferase involved in cell wall biosynthesis